MDRQDQQRQPYNLTSSRLNGTHPGDDPVQVLPLRAEPLACLVTHESYPDGEESTSIARLFDAADVCRCHRCDVCRASPEGMCLVSIPEHVADSAARLFSLADWRRARGLA
jgi:hypothetical protein